MTEQTKITAADTAAEAIADAVESQAVAVSEAAQDVSKEVAKAAKPAPRRKARKAVAKKVAAPAKTARKIKSTRKIKVAAKTARATQQRIETMTKTTNSAFAFDAIPAFAPFQNLMTEANERGQAFTQKSQKVVEEFADIARANVEAMVEAGQIAVAGAKSLGQDAIATGRNGVEQASDAIRSLAEAKSPTEYLQLQGEFARASFDRMVAESSKLTETMVKLAGEAFQPLQNRASANAERFNSFVA